MTAAECELQPAKLLYESVTIQPAGSGCVACGMSELNVVGKATGDGKAGTTAHDHCEKPVWSLASQSVDNGKNDGSPTQLALLKLINKSGHLNMYELSPVS